MIYLLRHGQTQFNLIGRMQGALDSQLTDLGVSQAGRMGALLKQLIGRAAPTIVASPQGRAQHTASIIAESLGASAIQTDERLREITLGAWDGLYDHQLDALVPGVRQHPDWHFRSPDGESYQAMRARLGEWLEEARGYGGDLVAVSHGVAGRILRGLVMGLPAAEVVVLPVPQDAVFRIRGDQVERIDCEPVD